VSVQNRATEWHTRVYGRNRRPLVVAKKLLEEASECHIAAKQDGDFDWEPVIKEAADCAIVCFVLAGMAGVQLNDYMNGKLNELLARGKEEQLQRDAERGVT